MVFSGQDYHPYGYSIDNRGRVDWDKSMYHSIGNTHKKRAKRKVSKLSRKKNRRSK